MKGKSSAIAKSIEMAIPQQIWALSTAMAEEGVSYNDYVSQLTYLFFIKMDEENVALNGAQSRFPEGLRWHDLMNTEGKKIVSFYDKMLHKLSRQKGNVGIVFCKARNLIVNPDRLKELIALVNSVNWSKLNRGMNGKAYEYLLESNSLERRSTGGQFFTPRSLISAIIDVMRPQLGETVCDPACGTGGFLVSAVNFMQQYVTNDEQRKQLICDTIYGYDNTPTVVSMGALNLFLHGMRGPRCSIQLHDSLVKEPERLFDVVLSNPPFGTRSGNTVTTKRHDFYVKTKNNQLNFLQHVMLLLSPGGRAAVVMPDNVLFESGAGVQLRRELLYHFNLHTILRLPVGIFYAPGVKANVLFFNREGPTTETWFYDYRSGIKHTLSGSPLQREHFDDFVACYNPQDIKARSETYNAVSNPLGRWRRFTLDEIEMRDKLNLDISWVNDDKEHAYSLQELIDNMQEENDAIAQAIRDIRLMAAQIKKEDF